MEEEGTEQEITLTSEAITYSATSAVDSVNGYTGTVVLTTSDLENTSDYQTGDEVESAISTAIADKQDTLTAGNNITISNGVISATSVTVDSALSSTSTNPVQNAVIYAAIGDIESALNTINNGSES